MQEASPGKDEASLSSYKKHIHSPDSQKNIKLSLNHTIILHFMQAIVVHVIENFVYLRIIIIYVTFLY